MNLPLRLREEASQDLADAAAWYEQQQAGLGQAFLDEVLRALQFIASQPRVHPVMRRNTQRALMPKFPFGIYFRVESAHIVVLAVMHGSRHPRAWRSRT